MKKFLSFVFIVLLANLNASVAQAAPEISLPSQVPADAGGTVTVPVNYTANGTAISSMIFSVDFDEANLVFDDTNTTGLPWPDAITVNSAINPFVFSVGITYDALDTDGELDFTFSDISPPLTALPEGNIVTITFTAGNSTAVAPVNFSLNPPASFGSTAGESVAGVARDGSVLISVAALCGDGTVDPGEECDDGGGNGACPDDQSCQPPGDTEICDDGIDNDGDGKTDCDDRGDCRKDSACKRRK